MPTDSRLHIIGRRDPAAKATVVFVHGLAGHPFDTWRRSNKTDWKIDTTFWPLWLRDDLDPIDIYSLEYPADITNWTGHAMPLQYRATNLLQHMLVEPDGLRSPVYFICHSLGGLVIKQVIRRADGEKDARPEAKAFLKSIGGVVFVATPHIGASLASTLSYFRRTLRVTAAITSLIENDPALIDLNQWYRNWADKHRDQCRHQVFFEERETMGMKTVTAGSADPGLVRTPVVPIDADHITICKPSDRKELLYKSVRSFLSPLGCAGA